MNAPTKTRTKISKCVLLMLMSLSLTLTTLAQEVPPLVYEVENTGVDCTKPPFPTLEELPIVKPLTDPFEWSDGSGRDTTFPAWTRRRNEIKEEIEHYEIGPKPLRPDTIQATLMGDTLLIITIIENGDTLILNSVLSFPEGEGPFPAIISIPPFPYFFTYAGSLPQDIFIDRDIASVSFNYWDVMQHTQSRGSEPINKLYPDLAYMGAYSAWSWGVSRLIDGLELVSDSLPIDLQHLAISGCSYAGKMALFAGAYDERIALTIAQESGGGGAAAWRVSETIPVSVETLGSTSHAWFMESMFQFAGQNVSKLPHDHHELMAMVAPRALLNIGNPSQVWLAEESGYTSCAAAKKVWENFGINDRMGYSFVTDHPHCQLPDIEKPEVAAFVDKFLLGDTTANTNITTNEYDYVVPEYWTDWWGNGDPYFPVLDRTGSEDFWYEAECGTVGAAWNIRLDSLASNGSYAVVKEGLTSTVAPPDSGAAIYITINVEKDTTYYMYARVNCPTYSNDALWLKIDDGDYLYTFGLLSEGWEWKKLQPVELSAGEHTVAIAYRDESLKFDKLCVTTFFYPPGEKGGTAEYLCDPDTTTRPYSAVALESISDPGGYYLEQNYPNPLSQETTIRFKIPGNTFVSLKVYSMLGEEIAELAGKEYAAGSHTVSFNARDLSKGLYFYMLKADNFTATRKMIIQTE